MKTRFTKFRSKLFTAALLSLVGGSVNAQCLTASQGQWPTSTVAIVCNGSGQTLAANCYADEYSTITVSSGVTYTFSSSIATDFLTIGNTTGTTAFASGITPVVWTSTITGNVRFYTHTNAACGAQSTDRSRIVTCAAPACPPPTAVSASAVTQNGATVSWSGSGNYILEYGPTGYTPGTGATAGVGGTLVSPATSPYTIPGLSNSTAYSVYVRNNCTATSNGFSSNSTTSFTTLAPPPPNDLLCNAITLAVDGPSDCQNTSAATSSGDPSDINSCSVPNNTVWYKFTPSTSGPVNIVMTNPAVGDGLISWVFVYTIGPDCTNPVYTQVPFAIGCQEGSNGVASSTTTSLTGSLTAGVEYYIVLDGNSGDVGSFCISIATPPPPPPCATNVTPLNGTIDLDIDSADPIFTWNAVAGATSYDFYLGESLATMTNIGNVPDTTTPVTGLLYGTTYYWYLAPVGAGGPALGCETNAFSFTTEAAPPPPSNDECAGAIAISGLGEVGSSFAATQSLPPSSCDGFTASVANDVWYSFVPETTGALDVEIDESSIDAVWEVFEGSCSGANLGCSDFGSLSLSVTAGQTYYMRVYSYSGDAVSIEFIFTGVPLPVSGVKLAGEISNQLAQLSWNTLTEQNNKGFEIQRSIDGKNFNTVGFVGSKAIGGNSNEKIAYSFTDRDKVNGSVYYRLQQTDIDGKTALSNVVRLSTKENSGFEVVAAPNPVKNSVAVKTYGVQASNATITVTDVTGKVMSTSTVTSNETIIDMNNFAQGIYLIKYTDAEHNETIKVSKQ